ncbi:MAG TPA: CBS domain-containing protein [Gammaproteobacteria bacterium]
MKTVSEIMTRDIVSLSVDDSIEYAAQQMCDIDVGVMPVTDGKKLIGVITDRDICCRVVASGKNAAQTSVESVMSPDIVSCSPETDVSEAVELMSEHQIRRLMIVDEKQQLVGIVAQADIATEPGMKRETEQLVERVSH